MRCIGITLFVAAAALATPVFAQQGTATTVAQAVSPKDHVNLYTVKKNVAPLAAAFGVPRVAADQNQTSTSNEADTAPAADEHKTLGDVADKALGDVEQVTIKVAGTLEKLAPQVWRIMVRQQYAKAFAAPMPALAWIVAMSLLSKIGLKIWPKADGDWFKVVKNSYDKMETTTTDGGANNLARLIILEISPLIIVGISVLFLFDELKTSILYLTNPEYYALQDLLRSIMSGGQVN